MNYIDTHCHLDGEEFAADRDAVLQRAREAGCSAVLVPAIDAATAEAALALSRQYPGYLYPMIGLHPEEVRADWRDQLEELKKIIKLNVPLELRSFVLAESQECSTSNVQRSTFNGQWSMVNVQRSTSNVLAIGEVGLDFYWSREFETEQLEAFEAQVQWAAEMQLPLMIHCRKAQNELVAILRRYESQLVGGVFHCFTGNAQEAAQLLSFERFVLGIGGVLTFKKSHLPEVLPAAVPLDRIVLETDAPYMAPVPLRGQRNEPSFIVHVIDRLAESYGVSDDEVCRVTTSTASRMFNLRA